MALAVVKKFCDLFMRQPSHFLFSNSELAHIFQLVRSNPFSESGQLTKNAAQIALLQIDSYRAGSFLSLLAKVGFTRQSFIAVMRKQLGVKIYSEWISECIDYQDQLIVNMLASSKGFAMQFEPEFYAIFQRPTFYRFAQSGLRLWMTLSPGFTLTYVCFTQNGNPYA